MTAKTRNKKPKAQTLNEFRAWLSGVEEMQEPGWIPNQTQWELIRQRIDLIKEVEPREMGHSKIKGQQPQQSQQPQQESTLFDVPQVPSAFDRVGAVVTAPTSSSLSQAPKAPRAAPSSGPTKTPDIDTSKDGYGSGFV